MMTAARINQLRKCIERADEERRHAIRCGDGARMKAAADRVTWAERELELELFERVMTA